MSSFEAGRRAEAKAALFLEQKGCTIMARNWRTRWCEIDIIAVRNGVVFLCEVKYRLRASQGSGLDYITPKKLRQMQFAAELWVASCDWQGDYQLCAIEVSGPDFAITAALKL